MPGRPPDWKGRTWSFTSSPEEFSTILRRLREMPSRATALTDGVDEARLGRRTPDGSWSAKEHIGHLDDLAPLDELRVREFLSEAETLSPADPSNAATEAARHNERPMPEILGELATRRAELVHALAQLAADDLVRTSEHPRLRQPMRLIDWAEFVAEHDDHHLAKAREALEG